MTGSLVFVVASGLFGRAEARRHTPPPIEERQVEAGPPLVVTFGTDLYVATDPVLRGTEARWEVPITRPSTWELAGDPVLSLRFAHAPELDPTSRLVVRLAGVDVAEVALDGGNAAGGVLDVPLPARLITDYAALEVRVYQRRVGPCADPFDPHVWTRIDADSQLRFPGKPREVGGAAAGLGPPLLDPRGYGPLSVTPVITGPVSTATLDAYTELALAFGREAAWRGVVVEAPVSTLGAARGPALLLGTLGELPSLDGLLDTTTLGPRQGLVAFLPHPDDPTRPVLVVSGRSGEGVRNAARALARSDRAAWLTGAVSVVDEVPDAPPPRWRSAPPFGDRVTAHFSELGVGDRTVSGLYAEVISVPVRLEGDVLPDPDGARVRLRYAYGPGLDPALSTLEVRYGGVGLASARLDQVEGEENAVATVRVPGRLVHPEGVLELSFHLYPEQWDACSSPPAGSLWGTVFADSELSIGRSRGAELPDLGLLRHGWFPFDGEAAPLDVVIGARADRFELAAAVQLVAGLGGRSTAEDPDVHIVVGEARSGHAQVRLLRAESGAPGRAFVEAIHHAADGSAGGDENLGHDQLRLSAPDGAALLLLARQLAQENVLSVLEGTRAVVGPSGKVAVVADGARQRVWRGTRLARARLWLQEEGARSFAWAFPAAIGLVAALRGWARRRGGVTP